MVDEFVLLSQLGNDGTNSKDDKENNKNAVASVPTDGPKKEASAHPSSSNSNLNIPDTSAESQSSSLATTNPSTESVTTAEIPSSQMVNDTDVSNDKNFDGITNIYLSSISDPSVGLDEEEDVMIRNNAYDKGNNEGGKETTSSSLSSSAAFVIFKKNNITTANGVLLLFKTLLITISIL